MAALLLGVRPPGSLYPDSAGLRHDLRGYSGVFTQADLWLLVCGRIDARDRLPQHGCVGAPYVHGGPGLRLGHLLRRRLHADRDPDRHQGFQLGRDHVGRRDPLYDRDAVRRRFYRVVYDGRAQRRDARDRPDRLADDRLVLHSGPLPLRDHWWDRAGGVRGDLLLVPEDDRADAVGTMGQVALLAVLHRLPSHISRPALPGADGDAA